MGDENSFKCVTVTESAGCIDGIGLSQGDSYFIPAGKDVTLEGALTAVIAELRRYGARTFETDGVYTAELYDDLGNTVASAIGESRSTAQAKLFEKTNITENDITL